MNEVGDDTEFGKVFGEYQHGKMIRIFTLVVALFFGTIWLAVFCMGVGLVIQGKENPLGVLIGILPFTLFVGGAAYFGLAVSRALIQVCERGIVYRTALRSYKIGYNEIAKARFEETIHESSKGEGGWSTTRSRRYALVLTPIESDAKDIRVKPLLGTEKQLLQLGVERWNKRSIS